MSSVLSYEDLNLITGKEYLTILHIVLTSPFSVKKKNEEKIEQTCVCIAFVQNSGF